MSLNYTQFVWERAGRYRAAGLANENGRKVILESHKEGLIGNLRCSNNNKRDLYGTFPRSEGTLHEIIEQLQNGRLKKKKTGLKDALKAKPDITGCLDVTGSVQPCGASRADHCLSVYLSV